jgi:hypothetical protein
VRVNLLPFPLEPRSLLTNVALNHEAHKVKERGIAAQGPGARLFSEGNEDSKKYRMFNIQYSIFNMGERCERFCKELASLWSTVTER